MEETTEIHIKSDILMAALNAFLILLCYVFAILAGYYYLKYFHNIDILGILMESVTRADIPMMGMIFEFLRFLVEDFMKSVLISALIYAAYISNFEITVKDNTITYKKGFLFLQTDKFSLADVEQVYTENYPFFKGTKKLCLKSLDEETIRIPYVHNALAMKEQIIGLVKASHGEKELEKQLKNPVKVMSWKPA